MKYVHTKDLAKMIPLLIQRGGHYQKAGKQVAEVLGLIKVNHPNPLNGIPKTNHGESRINHCIKFDLSGFCRLVTIINNDCCFLLYVGDHEQCDKWLERNKGLNVAFNPKSSEFELVFKSEDIQVPEKRVNDDPDYIQGKLITRLGYHYFDKIAGKISYPIIRELEAFDELVDEERVLAVASKIQDPEISYLVFDVFILVKGGSIDEAKNRILQFEEELKLIEELSREEISKAQSNNYFKDTNSLTDEDIQILMKGKSWLDWMLFMHPDQSKVVTASFSGPSRLLGVSGSGKTAIVVKRAVHLAAKYKGEKILVLTLNRSLSKLIEKLIDTYFEPLENSHHLRDQIKVSSYWEICRDLLLEFETDTLIKKSLNDFSDKHEDNIEEVWSEFYRCEENNDDAKILLPIHKSLIQRSILPSSYIKQEFDWIRSALASSERPRYKELDREGRAIPFALENREQILKGLSHWENLMAHVGITDYLGLTQKLVSFLKNIKSEYRSILVDEIQDFGTLELSVIRHLVAEGEDDLFLCGDIAQQVYTKHHKITLAGIKIQPSNYLTILKNYRNSREILTAAYQVFKANVNQSAFELDDFKVLQPEYANFSSPKPFLRESSSIQNEFNFALTYLRDLLEEGKKGCIAISGFSYYDVKKIGMKVDLPVLDGSIDLSGDSIFISDLEQTKGFEFDRMIIINCAREVLPNPQAPKEEWFRDISKVYVAMTRAKFELIISYSNNLSPLFETCREFFNADKWVDHLSIESISKFPISAPSSGIKQMMNTSLTGLEFLYTEDAIGLSMELQDKLIELVDGNILTDEKGNKLKWRNMKDLILDVNSGQSTPNLAQKFGRVVLKELQSKMGKEINIVVR